MANNYFIESSKGVIFSSSRPCDLILLYANLKGLFDARYKADEKIKLTKIN
jgi:hypothetical protein